MPVLRLLAVGLGKILSKVFGLATMTFFGRMPSRDDDRIAAIGVGSLLWLSLAVAALWPALAELLIPFVDDAGAARATSALLAVGLPPVIGLLVAAMHNNRGAGARSHLTHTVGGYVYAAVISVAVTALIVVVPLLKASYIVKRFTVVRVMIMIPAGCYARTIEHFEGILREAGFDASIEEPNRLMRLLFRWLGWVLGRIFHREVADELKVLRGWCEGDWFEVTVHAADVSIIGSRRATHLVHAALVDGMDERVVHLTWDDASQALEQRVRDARDRIEAGEAVDDDELRGFVDELARLELDREAWDAVRRLVYRLEVDAARAGLLPPPEDQREGGTHHAAASASGES